MASTAVRVALRVRPLTQKERLSNCSECLSYIPNEPQILIGTDKSFTYDYVFDTNTDQASVYSSAAGPLVEKFLEGQTGSGKTYSMGTGLETTNDPDNEGSLHRSLYTSGRIRVNRPTNPPSGIVPRCIIDLYSHLEAEAEKDPDFTYEVAVSFLELYNEELIDLLNPSTASQKRKSVNGNSNPGNTAEVTIREDIAGNIYWSGVREERCQNPEEVLGFLTRGSLCRTTGSTDMNTVSSRSHAIFSIILRQRRPDEGNNTKSTTSKFHFVDLAGSERLKRTNAQGDRAKEGIAINSGLLALGNVISALGDETRRTTHVPYRDSKLTRLLQDSLGGNSQTLMLACVSPADSNFMETLNTLKYANRARNIKNRVTINQDFAGNSIEVNQLRSLVARLRMEIATLRAERSGESYAGSMQREDEVVALKNENMRLRERLDDMSANLIQATSERDTLIMERDLGEFMNDENTSRLSSSPSPPNTVHPIIQQYQKTIRDLNNELADTRDRLAFLETMKPAMEMARANFSGTTYNSSLSRPRAMIDPIASSSQRRSKRHRRRRGGRMSASSSANTTTIIPPTRARKAAAAAAAASSSKFANVRKTPSPFSDIEEDEGFVNDLQDENIRQEVRDSIAKARDEIRKGMEVLELIKPLDDTAKAWEEELRVFEEEEHRLNLDRETSDEGHFSAAPSPVDDDDDLLDEIETLAVPSWENTVTPSEQRRQESGTSDLRSEMSEQSYDSKAMMEQIRQQDKAISNNPQMVRMLHQIQSDIKVKQELVSHLEKSENEYIFMRRRFDERIAELQQQLADLQREQDHTLDQTKSKFKPKPTDAATQQKEKQQLIDIRHAYEAKMKHLLSDIQDLRRKYAQTTATMQATRNQNETLLRSLRANVETLQIEKKRMLKRMKAEAERVREQMSTQERRIHQLQRLQAEANVARQRLEREHEHQKVMLKKRSDEILVSQTQLKQMINVLKKAVREGGILDERLLSRVSHIVGGSFALVARRSPVPMNRRSNGRKRVNPIPVQVRATRKKELLDKALGQFIQGKQAVAEMEQLLVRRERLATEKIELLEERKHIYLAEKENAEMTGQSMDTMAIELMDERIDLMSAEISYLSARIRALQSEAAGEAEESLASPPRVEKHVTFADEIIAEPPQTDEWADMDAFEEQFSVPNNAAPEVAYDVTVKLLKSLEADECRRITEALVDDIMNLKMSECNRQATQQNLEKTVMDLRRTLIVMKRAAIATTVENERRIRKLESLVHEDDTIDEDILRAKSPMDVKIEEYINGGNTIFDKIYEDGLRGMITSPEPTVAAAVAAAAGPAAGGDLEDHGDSSSGSSVAWSGDEAGNRRSPKPPKPLRSMTTKDVTGGRDATPSPDRFYNMIQKRLSWQQRAGGSESPVPITMISPGEFARYTADRDSSTSSIRSNHLRRSSLQSDFSSSQSNNSWNNPVRRLKQQRVLTETEQQDMILVQQQAISNNAALYSNNDHHPPPLPPSSPLANYSTQQQRQLKRQSMPPLNTSSITASPFERSTTPVTGNVFHRLSQTPTRASRAKMTLHRHSSGSIDDLRRRWEQQQQQQHITRMESPMY
ncbi:hypothetical protein BX666DRAFT_1874370 [Dichotomocladium elegans]|nr:hypothetical protein BX666DRAFT_1874370 [Dichotomocladium elegans]